MSRRFRRKKLPEGLFDAEVTALSDDGRGIARLEGKVVFIRGALAGEHVQFRYTNVTSKYSEGVTEVVLKPSTERQVPACPYALRCGGCSLHHLSAPAQRAHKAAALVQLFEQVAKVPPPALWEPLSAEPLGYRTKARLGVRYVAKKGRVLVGFREAGSSKLADIESCVVLDPRVGQHISTLRDVIQSLEAFDQIAQVEVALGENTGTLVFRNLVELSSADRAKLIAFGQSVNLQIAIQPKGPDSVEYLWPESILPLEYTLLDGKIVHQFGPFDFTQVNLPINQQMVAAAIKKLDVQQNDRVLDLFCGLGNFTLPLSMHCDQVVGVEGSQALVERAKAAAQQHGLNAEFAYANLYEAWTMLPWAQQTYNKLLLDPPRSGAQLIVEHIEKLAPEKILYISCHPATLARDAGILVNQKGYKLSGLGIMDMFPHTTHVESMALFEKE